MKHKFSRSECDGEIQKGDPEEGAFRYDKRKSPIFRL